MTEHLLVNLLWAGVALGSLLITVVFGSVDSDSNFVELLNAWKEKRLAEIELKKIQAQHERVCPRLTDTPRKM